MKIKRGDKERKFTTHWHQDRRKIRGPIDDRLEKK